MVPGPGFFVFLVEEARPVRGRLELRAQVGPDLLLVGGELAESRLDGGGGGGEDESAPGPMMGLPPCWGVLWGCLFSWSPRLGSVLGGPPAN